MWKGGFWIEGWRIDPPAATLERAGVVRRVDRKAMEVLCVLASRPGETVKKAELFDAVWTDLAVTDDVLTGAISSLRRALDDSARRPKYIRTLPRIGYALVAAVDLAGLPPETAAATADLAEREGTAAFYELLAASAESPVVQATYRARLGEHLRALALLEGGLASRDRSLPWIRVHPFLDPLRETPRFEAVVRALGPLPHLGATAGQQPSRLVSAP